MAIKFSSGFVESLIIEKYKESIATSDKIIKKLEAHLEELREATDEELRRKVCENMADIAMQSMSGVFLQHIKPPIGIKPRAIWLSERKQELYDAMTRYRDAGLAVPKEWEEELNNLF